MLYCCYTLLKVSVTFLVQLVDAVVRKTWFSIEALTFNIIPSSNYCNSQVVQKMECIHTLCIIVYIWKSSQYNLSLFRAIKWFSDKLIFSMKKSWLGTKVGNRSDLGDKWTTLRDSGDSGVSTASQSGNPVNKKLFSGSVLAINWQP